jgi:hypothetical protein
MARDYWFTFGSGNPTSHASLSPTFIFFVNSGGSTIAPPAVAETYSGSGMYKVSYHATQTIAFVLDGATTGLATSERYIAGVFDPQDMFGASLTGIGVSVAAIGVSLNALGASVIAFGASLGAIGTSVIAMGNTLSALNTNVGTTSSSFGSTAVDPTTVMGFLMRSMEVQEGNQNYAKASGVLSIYSRGSSTLLRSKTIADSTSETTKT